MVVNKAFSSQKNMDAPEPVANPYRGYLVHAHPQQFVTTSLG
jgi:hypothetical protein